MWFNSWPPTSQSRRKRTQGWRSCPIKSTSSGQGVQRTHRRNTSSGSSPTPGPSGISPGRRAGPSGTLQVNKPAAVQSCKRKGSPEEMQQGLRKKSRSESSPSPGPSHASSRGKRKDKSKKETPQAKKLWEKKLNPECPTESSQSPSPYSSSSSKTFTDRSESFYFNCLNGQEEFNTKYLQMDYLQEGGYAEVFAGVRIADNFPVAIKRMQKRVVRYRYEALTDTESRIPLEVELLIKVGAGPGTASCSVTPVLLDWYDLGLEIVLVLERPVLCIDMFDYMDEHADNDQIDEEAKVIFQQLVDAAIVMESKGIFHRDIKVENILIDYDHYGYDVPRARFIDFGSGTTFTPGQQFVEPQGTKIYSSPEWFRHEAYTAGPTTVWQLGLALYVLFFNTLPLRHEHNIHSRSSVPIPSNLAPEIRDFLKGCLEKDPSRRFSLLDVRAHPWLN